MTSARITQVRSSRLLQGSAWILIGLGIQSALGVTFWYLGAHVASSGQLGRASALFTTIQFVNYASGLGLTIALARHATHADAESDALFTWGIAATVLSSIVAGSLYLGIAHNPAVSLANGSPTGWLIFCAYTAGTSVGLLVDVRLMAARRWGWLVSRIAITGLVRLPFVGLHVGIRPDLWLYHLMLAPLAIGGILGVPLLGRIGAGSLRLNRPATIRAVARYSGVNWVASLASQAPQFVLPLLVAQSVRSSLNANFFLAWTFTGLVFLVPGAIAQVLLVEGSKDANRAVARSAAADGLDPDLSPVLGFETDVGQDVGHEPAANRAREALVFSLGLATLAWLGALVAGRVIPALLGDDYRATAHLLPKLMAAGIPWAITSVRLSEARIRRDQLATVAITATLGLGILVPAVLWVPHAGTSAATQAWLLGNVAAAIVSVVVHQRARRMPRLAAAAG